MLIVFDDNEYYFIYCLKFVGSYRTEYFAVPSRPTLNYNKFHELTVQKTINAHLVCAKSKL